MKNKKDQLGKEYDIAIIGGGVVGGMIAITWRSIAAASSYWKRKAMRRWGSPKPTAALFTRAMTRSRAA